QRVPHPVVDVAVQQHAERRQEPGLDLGREAATTKRGGVCRHEAEALPEDGENPLRGPDVSPRPQTLPYPKGWCQLRLGRWGRGQGHNLGLGRAVGREVVPAPADVALLPGVFVGSRAALVALARAVPGPAGLPAPPALLATQKAASAQRAQLAYRLQVLGGLV